MRKSSKGISLCQRKSSLTPLQQLFCPFMSIWPTRSSRLLSPAVLCARGLALNPHEWAWIFSFKAFPHLPLTQLCGLATGLHRGEAGMVTGGWLVFSVWGQLRAALAGLPHCGTGLGRLQPLQLPSLPPCNTGILGAELLLLCSPCLTKWFLHLTAKCSPSCFLLRQRNQTEEHWCHKNLCDLKILEKVATLAKHRPDEIPVFPFNLFWL